MGSKFFSRKKSRPSYSNQDANQVAIQDAFNPESKPVSGHDRKEQEIEQEKEIKTEFRKEIKEEVKQEIRNETRPHSRAENPQKIQEQTAGIKKKLEQDTQADLQQDPTQDLIQEESVKNRLPLTGILRKFYWANDSTYFVPHKLQQEEENQEPPLPQIPLGGSIQAKFAFSSFLVLACVLILLNIYPIDTTRGLLSHSKEDSMKRQLQIISAVLMELESLSHSSVLRVMTALETDTLTRVMVTDPMGKILYDSQNPTQSQDGYALIQEVYWALTGHDVMNTYFTTGKILSSAAAPIVYGDNTIGAIYLHEEDRIQGSLLTSLQENIYFISWVAVAFAALLYVIFSIFFTNRIRAMLAAIRIVGAGDYGHRLHPRGKDEMSYLAMEINILTDRLQTTEEVRRRFVSDASHELRTPLASIRLLADSILHNEAIDPQMTREFVSDICAESERLSRITERLLSLSKLDSLPAPVAEPVAIHRIIERILQNLELVAEEANISLRYQPEESHYILCTGDKLHQICYNIIENAVKYTPSGGFVQIDTNIEGNEVQIEIMDNGLGIPPEDLPKIFNRFYRVDDARSREAGGTGLGLAIVRDTVRAYGGWVEARNNAPSGTIFTVGLPKTSAPKPESTESPPSN